MKGQKQEFFGQLVDIKSSWAWLSRDDAIYGKKYVCEFHTEKDGKLKYLEYEIKQWISLNLKHPKK